MNGNQTNNIIIKLKRFWLVVIMLFIAIITSGCGLFLPDRSYIDEMDKDSEGYFVPGEDFPVVVGDEGVAGRDKKTIMERTPLSQKQQRNKMLEDTLTEELLSLENDLPEQEYQHYLNHASKLPTISEKIFFLRLKGLRERNEYLSSKGYISKKDNMENLRDELAIDNQEIIVGMSKDSVIQSWGRPMRIDVAGNPNNENERWLFYNYGKQKYVFFEKGKVKGWVSE